MYVEPRTTVTPTTIVLIATTGEWTRRRVADERAAAGLAKELGVPVYDVQLTGYPPRMREWNARKGEASRRLSPLAILAAARSSASATSVRTATPVPPLGV